MKVECSPTKFRSSHISNDMCWLQNMSISKEDNIVIYSEKLFHIFRIWQVCLTV